MVTCPHGFIAPQMRQMCEVSMKLKTHEMSVTSTFSLVSVCMSAMKSSSSLRYCRKHSIAAVVHWGDRTPVTSTVSTNEQTHEYCSRRVSPRAARRSCASGGWWTRPAWIRCLCTQTEETTQSLTYHPKPPRLHTRLHRHALRPVPDSSVRLSRFNWRN